MLCPGSASSAFAAAIRSVTLMTSPDESPGTAYPCSCGAYRYPLLVLGGDHCVLNHIVSSCADSMFAMLVAFDPSRKRDTALAEAKGFMFVPAELKMFGTPPAIAPSLLVT